MALTQITTNGIKDGTITGTDLTTNVDLVDNQKLRFGTSSDKSEIYNDGDDLFINHTEAGYLQLQGNYGVLLQRHNGTENLLRALSNGAVELYHDNSKKFETTSVGATVTGALAATSLSATGGITGTGGNFILGDSSGTSDDRIKLGASQDLQIYHNGTNSFIDNSTGYFNINSNGSTLFLDGAGAGVYLRVGAAGSEENAVIASPNGAVELYYDNSKKFETTSGGVGVSGFLDIPSDSNRLRLGASNDLQIYHNGTINYIEAVSGDLQLIGNSSEKFAVFAQNGAVELYYDNSRKFLTTSTGCAVNGDLTFADNSKAKFGAGSDLEIYHDGTNSIIKNDTNTLVVRTDLFKVTNNADSETLLLGIANGAVVLYHNNVSKFETTSGGASVNGFLNVTTGIHIPDGGNNDSSITIGSGNDFRLYHDGSSSRIIAANHDLIAQSNGYAIRSENGSETMATFVADAGVELYYDNAKKFETSSTGATVTGNLVVQDSSLPKIQSNFNGAAHLEYGVGGAGGGFAITTGHFLTFNHQPYANRGTDTNLTERVRITSEGNTVFTDKDSGHIGGGFYSRTKTVNNTGDSTTSFMRFTLTHGALAGMIYLTGSNNGSSVARVYSFVTQYGNTVNTNPISDTGAFSGKHFSFTSSTSNNVHTFMVQVSGGTQEVNMTVHLGNANQDVTYAEL